jgi:hypothetical protein
MPSSSAAPSVLDDFIFSYLAYQDTGANGSGDPVLPIPAGWVLVSQPSAVNPDGLTAVAFVNTTTQQIVIAYRGSHSAYDWLGADQTLASGITPQDFFDAEDYANSLKNSTVTLTNGATVKTQGYTLYVTGHSLGGADAEYVAATLNLGGAAFAGPGISALLPPGTSPNDPSFVDYVNQLDGIGNFVAKSGGYVGPNGKDTVLPAAGGAPNYSQSFLAGALGKIAPTILYHQMATYGQALAAAGLVTANPLASSPPAPVNLGDAINGLQNVQTTTLSNGSAVESGTFSVSTSGGTVTGSVSETFSPSDSLTLIISEQSGTQTASQTLVIGSTGGITSDNVLLDNATITSSATDPASINFGSNGSLLVGVPSSQVGDETTLVDSSNGSAALMLGGDQSSTARQIVDFAPGGLSGDALAITEPTTSTVDVTTEIQNGDTCEVSADANLSSVTQDFEFLGASGVLKLEAPTSFAGTILGFVAGDAIDLAGIGSATSATLGAGNVLAVQESGGGHLALQLDPNHNYSGDTFSVSTDGNGGTDVRVLPTVSGSYQTLDDPNAVSFTGPGLVTVATGINDSNSVVGYYFLDANDSRGYVETGGSFRTLLDPNANPARTLAWGINSSGTVVGYYLNPASAGHGFTESGGSYTTLGDPNAGANGTFAIGINNGGTVVGYYSDGSNINHGFVESAGVYTTLNGPNATGGTEANGINNSGTVVGYYSDASGTHGFIESGGVYTTLNDPSATGGTFAYGINNSGTVVGYYSASGVLHGFMEAGGVYTTLNDPNATGNTVAYGINDSGTVVGEYANASGLNGFVYTSTINSAPAPTASSSVGSTPTATAESVSAAAISSSLSASDVFFIDASGGNETITIPAAGAGIESISGFSLKNGDILNLQQSLAGSSWNGSLMSLGDFVTTETVGGNTSLLVDPSGHGVGTAVAVLNEVSTNLASLSAAHLLIV